MLTLLLILPLSPVDRDTAPVVEHNTIYDEQCRPYLEQTIFWSPDNVIDWRMTERTGLPEYDHARKVWRMVWLDGDTIRVVTSPVLKRSHTWQFDPEVDNRDVLPKCERRGLR